MPRGGRGGGGHGAGRGRARPAQPQRDSEQRDRDGREQKRREGKDRERQRDQRGEPVKNRPQERRREDPAVDDGPAGPPKTSIDVGSTENKPELVEMLPIGRAPGPGAVVLSLGPETRTETPLPDLLPGDRLVAFAELELTTDADDPNHPGLVGNA